MRMCILFLLVSFACTAPSVSKKPVILTSIAPYSFLVQAIVKDTADVVTIVPPGANPHVFEPSPRDVASVSDARVWVCAGEAFEGKLIKAVESVSPQLCIVDACLGIDLLGGHVCMRHSHEGADRHVWMSPKNAVMQAEHIAAVLAEEFPEHAGLYKENLSSIVRDLGELDKHIQSVLQASPHALLLLSHPSLAYFCRDYGLEQLSVETEGKDPLPQDISHLLEHVREHAIKKVFTQKGYNNKGAEVIARELGVATCEIDPYSQDYLNNLRHLAQLIASP